jgi:hypothetical protein
VLLLVWSNYIFLWIHPYIWSFNTILNFNNDSHLYKISFYIIFFLARSLFVKKENVSFLLEFWKCLMKLYNTVHNNLSLFFIFLEKDFDVYQNDICDNKYNWDHFNILYMKMRHDWSKKTIFVHNKNVVEYLQ